MVSPLSGPVCSLLRSSATLCARAVDGCAGAAGLAATLMLGAADALSPRNQISAIAAAATNIATAMAPIATGRPVNRRDRADLSRAAGPSAAPVRLATADKIRGSPLG